MTLVTLATLAPLAILEPPVLLAWRQKRGRHYIGKLAPLVIQGSHTKFNPSACDKLLVMYRVTE